MAEKEVCPQQFTEEICDKDKEDHVDGDEEDSDIECCEEDDDSIDWNEENDGIIWKEEEEIMHGDTYDAYRDSLLQKGILKLCPSKDCTMEYRDEDGNGSTFNCPGCLQLICTNCDVVYHKGMTCDAYQFTVQNPGVPLPQRKKKDLRPILNIPPKVRMPIIPKIPQRNMEPLLPTGRMDISSPKPVCRIFYKGRHQMEEDTIDFDEEYSGTDEVDSDSSEDDSDDSDDEGCLSREDGKSIALHKAYKQSLVEVGQRNLCPTYDCPMTYVVGEGKENCISCSGCFQLICTRCQVFYHHGASCEGFQNSINGPDSSKEQNLNADDVAKDKQNPDNCKKPHVERDTEGLKDIYSVERKRCNTRPPNHRLRAFFHLSEKVTDALEKCQKPVVVSNYSNNSRKKNCPTPDCLMQYTVGEGKANALSCPLCQKLICTKCHVVFHENMTCEFYQNSKENADNSLKVYMEEDPINRKMCPNCSSPIEKNGGCSHVICIMCHCHICWECGISFSTGREYDAHVINKCNRKKTFSLSTNTDF